MDSANPPTACQVLHHDAWLLVVDKPSGVLSHPNATSSSAGRREPRSAFSGAYHAEDRRFDTPSGPLWLVHRLDQGTSGVLLAAWDAVTAAKCRDAFERGAVEKHYLALVAGSLASQGIWKDALAEKRVAGKVRVSVRRGLSPDSELGFRVLASSRQPAFTLVDIKLVTGRTHQIRVQAASRRHPVLGDDVYGDFGRNRWARRELGLRRLFLHAASLTLPHPQTGRALALRSSLSEDLQKVLGALGFPEAW